MKIISNSHGFQKIIITLATSCVFMSGCGSAKYAMPYTVDSEVSSYRMVNITHEAGTAVPFAADLCVVASDITIDDLNMDNIPAAALFDINREETLYAKNVHERLYPASLTKIMTALVALKHGTQDMMLTASANVTKLQSGAQTCGIREGDQMTLSQALHLLLINSANDAAVLIAEGIGGSIEGFADMMNEEALLLGATNTHFVNPHGLHDDDHYTTVYDLYLMMNAAIQYESFNEIIRMAEYSTMITRNGEQTEMSVNSTNWYLRGEVEPPSGITVAGGKTGTTVAAGYCLLLLTKDTANNPYISIMLNADERDELYTQMTELLGEINN